LSTTCTPNFIEIEETFCERTDGNLTPINFQSLEVDLKNNTVDSMLKGGKLMVFYFHFMPKTDG